MAKKEYDWKIGEDPPKIDLHSLAKHRVYEEYLAHYIQVLNTDPRIPAFRLTLIDGFSGGGVYLDPRDNSFYPGSPQRIINACETAAHRVNQHRMENGIRNGFELQADYHFIEKKKTNYDYLQWYLQEQGFGSRLGSDIQPINAAFSDALPSLIHQIGQANKHRRCIFFLDQYGWSEVPFPDIKTIFTLLPRAEVILTMATDWLIDYMSKDDRYTKPFRKTGLDKVLNIDDLLQHKVDTPQWRQFVQYQLHQAIVELSGASHYTPFFIVSKEANKSFWLIHLSNHPRARDVMTQLHWQLKNQFAHYGETGFRMFGYDPSNDEDLHGIADIFGNGEFGFDSLAREKTLEAISIELPRVIHQFPDGIRFDELYRKVANFTPATTDHIKEAAYQIAQIKELEIRNPNGGTRRTSHTIKAQDVLQLPKQTTFLY